MRAMKPPIEAFLNWLRPHAHGGDAEHFGCVPGGDGGKAAPPGAFFGCGSLAERRAVDRWRKSGARVFDPAAFPRAFLAENGVDMPRVNMTGLMQNGCKILMNTENAPLIPGGAWFKYNVLAGCVTRVGYLDLDCLHIFECNSISQGLTRTQFNPRAYNRRGLLTRYFSYADYSEE